VCFDNIDCSLCYSTTAGNVEKFSAHVVLISILLSLDICHSKLCLFVGHVTVRSGVQVLLSHPERGISIHKTWLALYPACCNSR